MQLAANGQCLWVMRGKQNSYQDHIPLSITKLAKSCRVLRATELACKHLKFAFEIEPNRFIHEEVGYKVMISDGRGYAAAKHDPRTILTVRPARGEKMCITRREENCFAGGGDGTEAHLPNPPLPLLGHHAGRGAWAGAALPAVLGGGGGPTPTYMAQNDPRVALIILTTHMWGNIFS